MKQFPEKKRLEAIKLSREGLADEMVGFMGTRYYELLCNLWAVEEEWITKVGIKEKTPEAWARLEGFRAASRLVEKYANFAAESKAQKEAMEVVEE